ncbi:MAG: hypothetical protein JXA23_02070 [Bacteroidales bacterium]|nr:hypothetical protein [Bacteroidales bacterium]
MGACCRPGDPDLVAYGGFSVQSKVCRLLVFDILAPDPVQDFAGDDVALYVDARVAHA